MQKFKIFNNNYFLILSLLALIIFISSCSTTRHLPVFEIKPMTAQKILKKVDQKTPLYNNYQSKKISIDYDINNENNSLSGQIKTKRNKCIIITFRKMSLPLGRGYITPDSVIFINYFDKNYMAGDYGDLKKLLGIDVDYNLIQAFLTADISKILQEENFDKEVISDIDSQMYRINSQFDPRIDRAISTGNEKRLSRYMRRMNDSEFFDYSIWIDPQYFVVRKIFLNDIKYKKNISILYDQYELVGRSLFPQQVSLEFYSPSQKFSILLKLSKSSVNTDNDFSFSVPEKFEKIKVNKFQ
jgi:hypothetical protein